MENTTQEPASTQPSTHEKKQARSLRFVFTLVIILVIALAAGGWYYQSESYAYAKFEKEVAQLSQEDQDSVANLIRQADEWKAKFGTDAKDDMIPHIEAARYWKSVGLVHGLEYGLQHAASIYDDAIELFGENNGLLYQNAAGIHRELNNYDRTIEFYERAITLSPGLAANYVKLAEVHQYNLKSDPSVVLEIYSRALNRIVVGVDEILKSRAVYNESIDDIRAALTDRAKISALEPQNTAAFEEYERLLKILEDRGESLEEVPTVEQELEKFKSGIIE